MTSRTKCAHVDHVIYEPRKMIFLFDCHKTKLNDLHLMHSPLPFGLGDIFHSLLRSAVGRIGNSYWKACQLDKNGQLTHTTHTHHIIHWHTYNIHMILWSYNRTHVPIQQICAVHIIFHIGIALPLSCFYSYRFSVDSGLNQFKMMFNITMPGSIHGDELCYLFRYVYTILL